MKKLREQARTVAKATNGLLGPLPLQRVFRDHVAFFGRLRATGATWEQIASLLNSEGLRTRSGRPISAAVLRALYARIREHDGPPNQGPSAQITSSSSLSRTQGAEHRDFKNNTLHERLDRAARLRGSLHERN